MNQLDNIISWFSPKAGLRREQARLAAHRLSTVSDSVKARKYEAGSRSRRTKGWDARGTASDTEIARHGYLLRNRARDMVRNNGWAKKAARVIRTNVVGKGIKLSVSTNSVRATKKAKQIWKDWAETTACDFYKRKNIYGIQRQVTNAVFVDGEVLVRQRRNASLTPVPLELQVIEIDLLDSTKMETRLDGGGSINQGVEMDAEGRVVAYWLLSEHPGSLLSQGSLESTRVPREEILHIYHEERAGQIRGVTEMAASMIRLRDFDEYEDAQLIKQKVAACFSGFVHGDADPLPGDPSLDGGYDMERVEPGMIEYLPVGKQITFATPPEASGYEEHGRRVLQGVSAGMGISYESLTNDLSNVNFSSGRMGWIEMHRFIEEWQDDVAIIQLCTPVWQWFLQAARVRGVLPAKSKFAISWTPPRREMIDPVKETEGLNAQVRAGFVALQDVIRQLGGDPDEVLAKIAEDRAAQDAIDAQFTSDPRYDPQRKVESTDSDDSKKVTD